MPWIGLQCMIVAPPGYTRLLFLVILFSLVLEIYTVSNVPSAGLCYKPSESKLYNDHPATLIQTQASTYGLGLSRSIKYPVCAYCPYNFMEVEDRSPIILIIL